MKISEAIGSIPEKKENLRKAFESLRSHSSFLASFTLQWKDLEDHFSAIEKSIQERFEALQDKDDDDSLSTAPAATTENHHHQQQQRQDEGLEKEKEPATPEATPRPELKSLCAKMDAQGLRSYISENRKDLVALREELAPALRCALDPALLVLLSVEGFYPPNPTFTSLTSSSKRKKRAAAGADNMEGEMQINRRTCINLLEKLRLISPDIGPFVRDKAKRLATEWRAKVPNSGDNALEIMGFLQLVASYHLVPDFSLDDILELFISISRRKQAVDLIRSLGFTQDKLPDLIQKLNNKGRQLDAVKFVYAFNVVDKFPPVPLLKAYITESKKLAQEVRKKGNNSLQAQNEATAKEIGALKSVLKAVEEYKLVTEYPRETLVKRIAQLEQKQAEKKRTATVAAVSNSRSQLQQQPNKRPRPSPATSAALMAANSYPSLIQTQPQLGLAERAPYMGIAAPYGSAATIYGGPGLSVSAMGHGGARSPPRPYYSSESFAGTSSLYDRSAYNGYYLPGQPSSYSSSLYH